MGRIQKAQSLATILPCTYPCYCCGRRGRPALGFIEIVNQSYFEFFWNLGRFRCVPFVVEPEEKNTRKNFVKRADMMLRTLPITKRADILSFRVPEHLIVCLDERTTGRNNFSHLFPHPRYPIFYLGSIGPQASNNVSAGEIGLCGQRRGSC